MINKVVYYWHKMLITCNIYQWNDSETSVFSLLLLGEWFSILTMQIARLGLGMGEHVSILNIPAVKIRLGGELQPPDIFQLDL